MDFPCPTEFDPPGLNGCWNIPAEPRSSSQLPVGGLRRSGTPSCLGKSGRITRPTRRCGSTARAGSSRGSALWFAVCTEVAGRGRRSSASPVRLLNFTITVDNRSNNNECCFCSEGGASEGGASERRPDHMVTTHSNFAAAEVQDEVTTKTVEFWEIKF